MAAMRRLLVVGLLVAVAWALAGLAAIEATGQESGSGARVAASDAAVAATAARPRVLPVAAAPVAVATATDKPKPTAQVAYVTLLGSDNYAAAAQALVASLQGTTRLESVDVVVLAVRGLDPRIVQLLRMNGARVVVVDAVDNPTPDWVFDKHGWTSKRYRVTYTKLRAWELVEYERVVLIDNDMLALASLDALFELPVPSAVQYRKVVNPSVIVLRPDLFEFGKMIEATKTVSSVDGGELGFFMEYWRTSFHHIDPTYNVYLAHIFDQPMGEIKAVHLTGNIAGYVQKAWLQPPLPIGQMIRALAAGTGVQFDRTSPEQQRRLLRIRFDVLDTFWTRYADFWRSVWRKQCAGAQRGGLAQGHEFVVQQHGLAGIWRDATSGQLYFMRQTQNRLFWATEGAQFWSMAVGTVVGNRVLMETVDMVSLGWRRSLLLDIEVLCSGSSLVRLRMTSADPAGALVLEQTGEPLPPDPLRYSQSPSGVWAVGDGRQMRVHVFDHLVVVAGPKILALAETLHTAEIHGIHMRVADPHHEQPMAMRMQTGNELQLLYYNDDDARYVFATGGEDPAPECPEFGCLWRRVSGEAPFSSDAMPALGTLPRYAPTQYQWFSSGVYSGRWRSNPRTHVVPRCGGSRCDFVVFVHRLGNRLFAVSPPVSSDETEGVAYGAMAFGQVYKDTAVLEWYQIADTLPGVMVDNEPPLLRWWHHLVLDRELHVTRVIRGRRLLVSPDGLSLRQIQNLDDIADQGLAEDSPATGLWSLPDQTALFESLEIRQHGAHVTAMGQPGRSIVAFGTRIERRVQLTWFDLVGQDTGFLLLDLDGDQAVVAQAAGEPRHAMHLDKGAILYRKRR